MSEYKEGLVAEVTYKGERVRAARVGSGWQMLEVVDGYSSWSSMDNVTDVRPLVVLDPEDREQVNGLVQMSNYLQPGAITGQLTECIQNGLRSLVKPARIPEPGLWAVVEAGLPDAGSARLRLVRIGDGKKWSWQPVGHNYSEPYAWPELIDPVLVREGV